MLGVILLLVANTVDVSKKSDTERKEKEDYIESYGDYSILS